MVVKRVIKRSPVGPLAISLYESWYRWRRTKQPEDRIFYTLSPALLVAVHRSLETVAISAPELLKHGAYYEFGIFREFSLWYAEQVSRYLTGPGFLCYGFDSFRGLPGSDVDIPPGGKGSTIGNYAASRDLVVSQLRAHGTDMQRVRLFEGFYSESLFASITVEEKLRPPAVCVVDCDLYESTREVLKFVGPRLSEGCVLLFDDIYVTGDPTIEGQGRAVAEWRSTHPDIELRHLFDFGGHGAAYQVAAIESPDDPTSAKQAC